MLGGENTGSEPGRRTWRGAAEPGRCTWRGAAEQHASPGTGGPEPGAMGSPGKPERPAEVGLSSTAPAQCRGQPAPWELSGSREFLPPRV